MEFRPCIDIHNGKVKQIVGASLSDENDQAEENFVAEKNAAYYARLYKENQIKGGHVILLNPVDSNYYEATKKQAMEALGAYPFGLQIGGGICDTNATQFLEAGASHVIVTSFVFKNGCINYENLDKMKHTVGKEHLVLDLSCKEKNGVYYIVTDRWQKFTMVELNLDTLKNLASYADEFLVHAADVEGQQGGIDEKLVMQLAQYDGIPLTYAGGVADYHDIERLKRLGNNRLNVTIGSALDLFGGRLSYKKVLETVRG